MTDLRDRRVDLAAEHLCESLWRLEDAAEVGDLGDLQAAARHTLAAYLYFLEQTEGDIAPGPWETPT